MTRKILSPVVRKPPKRTAPGAAVRDIFPVVGAEYDAAELFDTMKARVGECEARRILKHVQSRKGGRPKKEPTGSAADKELRALYLELRPRFKSRAAFARHIATKYPQFAGKRGDHRTVERHLDRLDLKKS
jgi:hypothetical protein